MYVCACKGITESDVENLGRAGVTCPDRLASALGIDDEDTCCGRCLNHIVEIVTIASQERPRCRTSTVVQI